MTRLLTLLLLLVGAASARAQEPPARIATDYEAVIGGMMEVGPMRLPSQQWIRESFNPALRQRQEIRRMLVERNTGPVRKNTGRIRFHGDQRHVEPKLWCISIGNTAMNNFSPFPDRLLDARTLRFPMPRK